MEQYGLEGNMITLHQVKLSCLKINAIKSMQ